MKTNLTNKQALSILAIVIIGVLLGALILFMDTTKPAGDEHGHGARAEHAGEQHAEGKGGDKHGQDEHGHGGAQKEAQAKGPHGGKLFEDRDFGLEIVTAEEGGEVRFRVYLFNKDKPLAPNAANVSVTLTRPNGEKQELAFTPEKDYLKSDATIAEPHVFEATIAAQTGAESYLFTWTAEEGMIAMADDQIKAAGITINTAGPAKINSALTLPGEIRFNEDKTAHVAPRLAGVVESVRTNLGEKIKKGQVLAVIASTALSEQRSELLSAQKRLALARTTFEREKKLWQEKISAEQDYLQARQAMQEAEIALHNAQQKLDALGAGAGAAGALNRYEIRAPFDGMVVEKHLSLGEAVKEDANIFIISDLSTVWAEVAVPAKDLNAVRVGEKVMVNATAFDAKASGTIAYVGSLLGEQTRTAKARVALANPDVAWRPGLFVNVEIVSEQTEAAVAVTTDGVHSVDNKPTVFIRVPGGFLPQHVTLGRSDGKMVEVTKGIKPGTRYAGAGSFIVKSELGKASAEHTH
jgi:cobalt-zinc-cadmium efflux system membrane fusion protein